MIPHAILHDTRLAGRAPGSAQGYRLYRTNGNISLNWTFHAIKNDAHEHGGIDTLHIYSHGYAGENEYARVCGDFGGQGLQLGRESLTLNNIKMVRMLSGSVSNIIVHACAAADSTWAHLDMFSDGKRLMSEMAMHSGAFVTAADKIQWYHGSQSGRINFGEWEGNVLMFSPYIGEITLVGRY